MAGSRKSAMLFLTSSILLFIQSGISAFGFENGIGAMAAGALAFTMIVAMWFATKGRFAAVMDYSYTDTPNYDGTYTRTSTYRDTGERIQMTPCCGIGGGIVTIVIAILFAGELEGDIIIFLSPAFLAGILAFIAGIIFVVEYKGPWTAHA
ncbi:MAG: hypothetical protein ACTSYL_03215 [Candidatus Thorarchaeota archaeon]